MIAAASPLCEDSPMPVSLHPARRAVIAALLLLCAAPAIAQDEEDGEEPYVPGQLPGMESPTNPMAVKRRKWTSLQLLQWTWDAGVAPPHSEKKAMAAKDAIISMADRDDRPILIYRSCAGCKRDDHDLLDRELNSDKTILFGRWYHAIRFSDDILAPDHPYHALFDGKVPPHLVVATADGANIASLSKSANQSQLWKTLSGILRKAYKKDPEAAAKSMLALLDEFDRVDTLIAESDEKIATVRREKGEDSKEAQEVEAARKAAQAERELLLQKGKELDDLQLKVPQPAGG
jgi:hypothetical protein